MIDGHNLNGIIPRKIFNWLKKAYDKYSDIKISRSSYSSHTVIFISRMDNEFKFYSLTIVFKYCGNITISEHDYDNGVNVYHLNMVEDFYRQLIISIKKFVDSKIVIKER